MFGSLTQRSLFLPGIMAIGCFLLGSSAAQKRDSPIQEHFRAAEEAMQQGRLDAAALEYQAILRLRPESPEVYANLGLIYYSQAKFDSSAKALAIAEKMKPGLRGVSLWLGIDYVKLNRPAQGAIFLREAVRLDPSEKLAQSWLGTALWDSGQTEAALLQLRKAAARFPDDPDLLFGLGEAYGKAAQQEMEQLRADSSGTALSDRIYGSAYTEERDWAKAEGHLRRAIERDPHSLDARLELAQVLLVQARLPATQEQLDQAAAIAPRSAAVLARSGELLILIGQPAEGLSRIEQAVETDRSEALDALGLPLEDRIGRSEAGAELLPLCRQATEKMEADPTARSAKDVALAAIYALMGDEDASLRAYRRISPAKSNSNSSAHLTAPGMDALHRHHYDEAEATLIRWLATHPADLSARYRLVLARRQISIAQISRLRTVAPDSYHVHQWLGQLYTERKEDSKALTEYLAVAFAQPNLPGLHFWLGHLYWNLGDADHALAELTRELELDPGHPEANGELGALLVSREHAGEAIPHLEEAIRVKPDLWPAYAQLGRAYAMEKNYARAEEVLKRGLAHDQDGATHYQFGRVLIAEGKTEQAAQVFSQLRAIKNEIMAPPTTDDQPGNGTKQ